MGPMAKNATLAMATNSFTRIGSTSVTVPPRPDCLPLARAAEDVAEGVIRFVARVLIQLVARCRPGVLPCPRLFPRRRILDGEPIEQRLAVDAGESFDDMEVLARSSKPGLVREVRRV